MKRVDELIIVIPVILNLKGNLEMNLSSRLGTAVSATKQPGCKLTDSILEGKHRPIR